MSPLVLDKRSNSEESISDQLRKDDDEKRTSIDDEVESISGFMQNPVTNRTLNRKELLARQSSSRKLMDDDAGNTSIGSLYVNTGTGMSEELLDVNNSAKKASTMDGETESSTSGISLNTGSGKTMLRKELLIRKSSLTVREFEFLNELIQSSDVKAAQLKKAAKVLGDSNIFFDCDNNDLDTNRFNLHHSLPARLDHQTSSSKRLSALKNRCASNIYYDLWRLHEKGISTNSSLNPRSSFHARRSMPSFNMRNELGRERTNSLNLDKQKNNHLRLENVVTLVKEQINPQASPTCSTEQIPSVQHKQQQQQQPKKSANDKGLPPRPILNQLETLREEGSYRITSSESTSEQRRNEVDLKVRQEVSLSNSDQEQVSDQLCSDRKVKEWWESSEVEQNDSLLDIMAESSEAAASLPVVLRSNYGSSSMSQINSFPSLRRAHSVHSSSSFSLAPSSLFNAELISPSGTSLSRKMSFASIHRARPVRSFSSSFSFRTMSVCSLDDMDLERSTRHTGLSPIKIFSVLRSDAKNLRRNVSSGRQVSFCNRLSQPLDDGCATTRPTRLITREASVNAYSGEGFEVMDPISNEDNLVSSRLFSGLNTRKRSESGTSEEDPEILRHMPALFRASDSNLDNGVKNLDNIRRIGREKSDSTMSAIEQIWRNDSNKDFLGKSI
jgi:hypothetical protein